MGQKVNPIGMRVTVNKDWRSRWYANKKEYGNLVLEDDKIRAIIMERLKDAAIPEIIIERYANRARVTIYTARPGIVIGKKGADSDKLRTDLSALTGKEVYIDIKEVKNPDLCAALVAENIAVQLERRVSFRRAMKRAIQMALQLGAKGVRIRAAGRLGGAELARCETYKEGTVPLQTLKANVDYGFREAHTVAGKIGIKVWLCKPDEEAEPKERPYAPHA